MPSRKVTALLFAAACISCSAPPRAATTVSPSHAPRLIQPEQVVQPPPGADWLRPAAASRDYPHYPVKPRGAGIEARVIAAFVVDTAGRVEYRTISLIRPVPRPEFVDAVCTFLRRAAFDWGPHPPARAMVVMPFEFALYGARVTEPMPPRPNLATVRGDLARLTPVQLAEWVDARPHCP